VKRRFNGTYDLHLLNRKSAEQKNQAPATCLLLLLLLDPEDVGDTFLRNVGSNTDYTALHPRRQQRSSYSVYPNAASIFNERSGGVLHKHWTVQNLGREITQQQRHSAQNFTISLQLQVSRNKFTPRGT
jgi:hypothetical protein